MARSHRSYNRGVAFSPLSLLPSSDTCEPRRRPIGELFARQGATVLTVTRGETALLVPGANEKLLPTFKQPACQ